MSVSTELSPEDLLRLNVLMAGEVQAVRIDEGSLTLFALTERGEASVRLNPTTGTDAYLRKVREFLGGAVLQSPGGYPVYLQRWTRMGQARDEGLDKLLLLGEPEAVVSVAYSAGITDELARRAWWAMPTADNARRMLERECVAQGNMGHVLADYLVEHLPFENDAWQIIDTVRTILPLIGDEARLKLWNRGRHDNAYYVAFLEQTPDLLPRERPAHPRLAEAEALPGTPGAKLLLRAWSPMGQCFLYTANEVLARPGIPDVAAAMLDALGAWAGALPRHLDQENWFHEPPEEAVRRHLAEEGRDDLAGLADGEELLAELALLAQAHAGLATPILRRTNATGTLLKRKLEPITGPLAAAMARLNA